MLEVEKFEQELKQKGQSKGVPDHTLDGLIRYTIRGTPPGGFLKKVLSNDLFGAFGKADLDNRQQMYSIISFIYNDLPSNCWSSEDIVKGWINAGGLMGKVKSNTKQEQEV